VSNKKHLIKSALLRDALALFLITLISGLALSYVYEITKEPIKAQGIQKSIEANKAVFSEASSFEEDVQLMELAKTTDLTGMNADFQGVTIDGINKALNNDNQLIGYNITVSTSAGYKDGINFVFGYSLDGSVTGIEFLAIKETAGLGMKAAEPEFMNQFLNKKVNQFVVTKAGASSDEEIDALSGATITSRAVANAINAGIAFLTDNSAELGGGQ
jgi:electron transport complex protein RnfG